MKGGHVMDKKVTIKNSSAQKINATGQSKNSYGPANIKKGTDLILKKASLLRPTPYF